MHILNVEIQNQSETEDALVVQATILLKTEKGHINLTARANRDEISSPNGVKSRLMDDALRQLRRMPGYRNGEQKVTVSPDALLGEPKLA